MNGRRDRRGMSLVEALLAVLILGTVSVAIIGLYVQLGTGTIKAKTRTIATNMAGERIESLKAISYYRVVVSTDTDPNSPTYGWPQIPDSGIASGGFLFDRYVQVDKLTAVGSSFTVVSPYSSDTGIKRITVLVRWSEGGVRKSFSLTTTMEDPNRVPLGGNLSGTVTDGVTASPISGAKVTSLLNLNWTTVTDSAGTYALAVGTGAMRFQASARGYFSMWSSTLPFTPGSSLTWSPGLNPILTGNVSGYAIIVATNSSPAFGMQYGNPPGPSGPVLVPSTGYLKISQVMAGGHPGLGSFTTHEFIELYNPTSHQISFNTSNFKLYFIHESSGIVMGNGGYPDLGWLAPTVAVATVPAGGFLLIGSTGTFPEFGGLTANASYYNYGMPENQAEGVAIGIRTGGLDVYIDSAGWCRNHGGFLHAQPLTTGYEETPFEIYDPAGGLGPGQRLMRKARATSTIASMSVMAPGLLDDTTGGNMYDTEVSSLDFVWLAATTPWLVGGRPMIHNLSVMPTEWLGASSATVTIADGLSSPVFTDPYGYFRVTGVATAPANGQVSNGAVGDWTVEAATTLVMGTTYPVYVGIGLNTSATVYLTGSPVSSTIVGEVKHGDTGAPLSGIKVTADANTAVTDANGRFILVVTGGTSHLVVANPANANFNYTETSISKWVGTSGVYNVPGTPEGVAPDGEMWLYPQAAVSGKVTTGAANDPVPFVVITASSSNGLWTQSALTSTTGFYLIKNLRLTAGYPPYEVKPVLDQSDSSVPASRSVSPLQGTTTGGQDFSMTFGWATITGTMQDDGGKIFTGVLMVATTDTTPMSISAPDPINASFRAGSDVYYGTISLSDGSYAVRVRFKASTPYYVYTIYAWYTRVSGDLITTYKAQKSVTVNGTSITVNFNASDWSAL